MKIEKNTLDDLYNVYQNSLALPVEINMPKAMFEQAFQFIEDRLNDYFDWDTLSNTEVNEELVELLKQCLVADKASTLAFDPLAANAALVVKQQSFTAAGLHLARDIETTGIQEKYLKSQLSSQEPLTDLDIKRFVANTGMRTHIQIVNLNAQEIGLILHDARTNHAHAHEPYSITMMVNAGTEGEPAYSQWISVSITVNPLNNEVKYTAHSGVKLSEVQRAELEETISNAIKFEAVSAVSDKTFSAFPRAAKVSGTVISHDAGKLGSYKALQELYKDEVLIDAVADNDIAQAFANEAELKAVKQVVYEVELKAITISPSQAEILPQKIVGNFEFGKIKAEELKKQLELLSSSIAGSEGQHPLVVERISEVQLYNSKVSFPGEKPEPPLTSVDYQQFLLLVNDKFKRSELNKVLDEMVIFCYDSAALEGLIAYNETNQPVPFQTLSLNIDNLDLSDGPTCERFLFDLKTMLLTMSESNLSALRFIDTKNQLSHEMVTNLVDFIAVRAVAIDINLPAAFQSTLAQKKIDEVVSDNVRRKNIAFLGKGVKAKEDSPEVIQEIRTRPILEGKQSLSIDIELQQEQQVEVAVDAGTEKVDGVGELEPGAAVLYTMYEFQDALSRSQLDGSAKSYLVNSEMMSVIALWLNWTGALTATEAVNPATGFKISKTACEELLRYKDKFQFGLDLKNLPAGFLLKKEGQVSYIHFDENYKLLAEYNPLQVQATELSGEKPLTHSLLNKWLDSVAEQDPIKEAWTRLNTADYNKDAHQAFKRFLPQMLLLDATALERLFTLCFDQNNNLDSKKFCFILENAAKLKEVLAVNAGDTNINNALTHLFAGQEAEARLFINNYAENVPAFAEHLLSHLIGDDELLREKIIDLTTKVPQVNLNALLQLYAQFGEKGIDTLMQLVDSDVALFNQLNAQVFANTKTYGPLLRDDYKDAFNAIQGFTEEEQVWWSTLLQQHCQAQNEVNLVDLVKSFKAFKEQLKKFPTHDGQPLTLPALCTVTGVKSLPVALSRILTILEHCNQQNRHAQWGEVSKLDLSSTGAIKPALARGGKQWAFITPKMQINAAHETEGELFGESAKYKVPNNWKNIAHRDPAILQENFFRYVAYQEKNGQMPLEFYRYVQESLDKSGLSAAVKEHLYSLIAASTTEARNVAGVSIADAKKDIDNIINLVISTPLPGLTPSAIKESARTTILELLTNLRDIPPLPVLNRLLSLISSSLSGPIALVQNGPKLGQANADLRRQVEVYGPCIYDGMKDYKPTDYENPNLFFSHMAMVNKVADTLGQMNIVDAQLLMRMISSFGLTLETLDTVLDTHFVNAERVYRQRRNEALQLLRKVSVRDNPGLRALNADDLLAILQAVKNKPQPVVEVLNGLKLNGGQSLAAYFPADLLANYGKEGIPEEVTLKIAAHFNEKQQTQINTILLRFSAPGDTLHYGELVDKIIAITKPLGAIEKNIFIAKLTTSLGFYTNKQPLSQEDNHFITLLDTIIANNSSDELINLVAAERNLYSNSSEEQVDTFFVKAAGDGRVIGGLSQRALLHIQTIVPAVRAMDNLVISQIDLTPRLHNVLLKTPIGQLTAASTVVSEEEQFFALQEALLAKILNDLSKGNKIDFAAAESSTDNFINTAKLDDSTSFEKFRDTAKETGEVKKVNAKDLLAIAKNPSIHLLVLYFTRPDLLEGPQRLLFETRYKAKVEKLAEQHPDILLNKDLLPALLQNPAFFRALAEQDALKAAGSPDLLESDEKLALFFDAVDNDLKGIAAFKKQTLNLQQELSDKKTELNKYPNVFMALYKKINAIAITNPSSKKQFLELYDRYLEHYSPEQHGELLKYLTDFVSTLEKSFAKTTDKNMVLSLCLQFNSDTDEELQPEGVLQLLNTVDTLPEEHRATVLKIAVALINNEKDYSLVSFSQLCQAARENPEFADALAAMYKKAPFATVTQVMTWHAEAQKSDNYAATISDFYNAYNKAPCHRELFYKGKPLNGFHVEKAREQLAQFDGFDASRIDLDAFKAKTDAMRDKTSDELLAILAKYNAKNPAYDPAFADDYDTLVAVAAELFHRSKGKDEIGSDGEYALGSSMEINTTQYLAILTSLKTPGHVTSQIGTGEGKSRIMMISMACQYAQGKTVDFVTSDAQLATRDFVEYQAYFDMIGAETSMIFAHTDPSLYKIGGINFSDPSNLSLFRNKARSLGQGEKVLDADATNRALLLDEADKTYFDVADTRFNFSKEGDENIRGMEWVYPLLMEYFAQEKINLTTPLNGKTSISPMDLYYQNVDLSREKFLLFVNGKKSTTDMMRLRALSNAQIEQWQVSAVTASQLQYKKDFVIEPDVLISTPTGPKISSEAQLLFANRVSKSSKFSFGVHQCLHAGLNLARNDLDAVKDVNLRTALAQCEQAFYVPDEKQIVYSSTSKNLLDDYSEGTLKAVTGTSGSLIERQEARELYGLESGSSAGKMHFIDVPRDRGIHRKDRAIRLTGNQRQQIDALVGQIKEAREKNQPILIIAENDEESAFLYKKLSDVFKNDSKLQHIHSQLSARDEKDRTDIAGLPGQITVSTDMIGRGTDISLRGAAKTHGLNVMVTYLPRHRDKGQIIGRSGRFGAAGETSLVLDKARLKKQLGKITLTDGFYKNTEAYIEREQALMDRNKQCERLIKNTVGDFRKGLTNYFFEDMLKQVDQKDDRKLLSIWTVFFDKSDKSWNEIWPHIQKELGADKPDVTKIASLLSEYESNVQKMWNTLRRNVQDTDVTCNDGQRAIDKLPEKVPHLELSATTKKLLTGFDINKYSMHKWAVYDHYDPGHEGRAVKYSHWSIPMIASLKGYANLLPFVNFSEARRPFANFRAWLEGHGQLFPELRASENKGKIIGTALLGVLGAAAGGALIASGVLAPLGFALWGLSSLITSIIIGAAAGLVAGAGVGLTGGAIIDAVNAPDKSLPNEPEVHESYSLLQEKGVANFLNPRDAEIEEVADLNAEIQDELVGVNPHHQQQEEPPIVEDEEAQGEQLKNI
ncbi:hypothetical protein ACD661_08005 [Legionella lytica]|uniref:Protein translocase subunit SecA n=1 Tax=Legionella lytica TaxID=96232 RepID=A0ABW8D717_9GAMM